MVHGKKQYWCQAGRRQSQQDKEQASGSPNVKGKEKGEAHPEEEACGT